MTRPAAGVNPIVVSIDVPSRTAANVAAPAAKSIIARRLLNSTDKKYPAKAFSGSAIGSR